jgi:hypothetical protein
VKKYYVELLLSKDEVVMVPETSHGFSSKVLKAVKHVQVPEFSEDPIIVLADIPEELRSSCLVGYTKWAMRDKQSEMRTTWRFSSCGLYFEAVIPIRRMYFIFYPRTILEQLAGY